MCTAGGGRGVGRVRFSHRSGPFLLLLLNAVARRKEWGEVPSVPAHGAGVLPSLLVLVLLGLTACQLVADIEMLSLLGA